MNKTKIYIVDDHDIVAQGIKLYLAGNDNFEFIGSSLTANGLFEFLKNKQTDILILDIKLPGLSGYNIARIVSEKYPKIKIIFLSSLTDEKSLNLAIEAGGLGYLSKDVSESEFILALEKINKNESYYSTGIQQLVYQSFTKKAKSENQLHLIPLSKREIEVIKLFVDGASYKEIAKNLSISIRTVETHKKNILTKLNLKTTVDLVKYAIINGIISI